MHPNLNPEVQSELRSLREYIRDQMNNRAKYGNQDMETVAGKLIVEEIDRRLGLDGFGTPTPYDTLYVVEHIRDGKWRMHIGLEVCAVRSYLELKELPRLQKEWPNGQFRITEYHPAPHKPY